MEDAGSEQIHPPAGWYPDTLGNQRFWDGNQWTEQIAPPETLIQGAENSTTIAAIMHISAIFTAFIGPLIGYYAFAEDEFVHEHSRQALNFQLTAMLGYVVSALLIVVLIGVFTFFAIGFAVLILHVMGAAAASKGERFEFPLTLNIIKS